MRVGALTLSEPEAGVTPMGQLPLVADVSDPQSVDRAFAELDRQAGRPHVVVHCAGVDDPLSKARSAEQTRGGRSIDVLADLSDEQWQRMIRINLDGAFFVLRCALRSMRDTGGAIVMIGSETGVRGLPGLAHYGASKGGVHALVRSAATEAIHYGVRVNGVAPGVIDTPMSRRSEGVFGAGVSSVAPIGRPGLPSEIANVVAFLAGDLASYVVGEIVQVDGGRLVC
jgi:3-oxoacyl-[acyl-carrier protein] reductase